MIHMNKNYPMRLYTDESSDLVEWIAEYSDLPGCIGVGDTAEEAIAEAEINKNLWLEAAEKSGSKIPEPSEIYSNSYSGKFNIRLPKFLHKALSIKADEEETSLNQLCVAYLSMGLAQDYQPSYLSRVSYSVASSPTPTFTEQNWQPTQPEKAKIICMSA